MTERQIEITHLLSAYGVHENESFTVSSGLVEALDLYVQLRAYWDEQMLALSSGRIKDVQLPNYD